MNTEITFEPEQTSENFERPPAPDTKGRRYRIIDPPEMPDPHAPLPPCADHDKIKPCMPDFQVPNDFPRNKDPILRPPPAIPKDAIKSGSCVFYVNVNEQGRPTRIHDLKCSDSAFISATKIAAMKWRFNPNIVKGKAVPFISDKNKIRYELLDEDGNLIPE